MKKTLISTMVLTVLATGLGATAFAEDNTHKVVSGDTLWGISQKNKTTVDKLKKANGLKSDLILVGQELKLTVGKEKPKDTPKAIEVKESYVEKTTQAVGSIFEASYYSIGDGFTPSTMTADGTEVSGLGSTSEGYSVLSDGTLVLAVDRNQIPLGTQMKVTFPNGESYIGVARDTGSAIVGNRVDVLTSNPNLARELGRNQVTIELL